MFVDSVCSGQTDVGSPAGFQTASHCLDSGLLQLDISWRRKKEEEKERREKSKTVVEKWARKTKSTFTVE